MDTKHFFLATDLTGRSDRAWDRAVRLAAERDADLTVLSVVERGLPPRMAARRIAEAREDIEAKMSALGEAERRRVSVDVVEDEPFSAIVGRANQSSADVIILGVHAKLGFVELFTGTTTERVMRYADRPVLLVCREATAPYARVVAAVDLTENAAQALSAAHALAPHAEISVVHAWEIPAMMYPGKAPPRDMLEAEMKRRRALLEAHIRKCLPAAPVGPRVTIELIEGAGAAAIRSAVERLKPDLLAVGAHGRSGLPGAILGSTTRELLADAPCDMLVARA